MAHHQAQIATGRLQLVVASPLLDADDLDAIRAGYLAHTDAVSRSLLRQIEATPSSVVRDRLGFLAWPIAEDRLDIRIAVGLDEAGQPCGGIYHEKGPPRRFRRWGFQAVCQ